MTSYKITSLRVLHQDLVVVAVVTFWMIFPVKNLKWNLHDLVFQTPTPSLWTKKFQNELKIDCLLWTHINTLCHVTNFAYVTFY